jgi:hypothetical protein
LQKWWDDILGPQGLVEALKDFGQATDEIRVYLEWGDVLAENLSAVRRLPMIPSSLRSPNLWREIDEKITAEAKAGYEFMRSESNLEERGSKPETPTLDAVDQAARELGWKPSQLRWEIETYAKRCGYAHSRIGAIIQNRDYNQLAMRICRDKKYLQRTTKELDWDSRQDNEHLLQAIDNLRDRYFAWLKVTDDGGVAYELLPEVEAARKRWNASRGGALV